jgi:hypothetical protein
MKFYSVTKRYAGQSGQHVPSAKAGRVTWSNSNN